MLVINGCIVAFAVRRLPYFQTLERKGFLAFFQFIQQSLIENDKNSNVFEQFNDAYSRRLSPRNLPDGFGLFDGFVFNIHHFYNFKIRISEPQVVRKRRKKQRFNCRTNEAQFTANSLLDNFKSVARLHDFENDLTETGRRD